MKLKPILYPLLFLQYYFYEFLNKMGNETGARQSQKVQTQKVQPQFIEENLQEEEFEEEFEQEIEEEIENQEQEPMNDNLDIVEKNNIIQVTI